MCRQGGRGCQASEHEQARLVVPHTPSSQCRLRGQMPTRVGPSREYLYMACYPGKCALLPKSSELHHPPVPGSLPSTYTRYYGRN